MADFNVHFSNMERDFTPEKFLWGEGWTLMMFLDWSSPYESFSSPPCLPWLNFPARHHTLLTPGWRRLPQGKCVNIRFRLRLFTHDRRWRRFKALYCLYSPKAKHWMMVVVVGTGSFPGRRPLNCHSLTGISSLPLKRGVLSSLCFYWRRISSLVSENNIFSWDRPQICLHSMEGISHMLFFTAYVG